METAQECAQKLLSMLDSTTDAAPEALPAEHPVRIVLHALETRIGALAEEPLM